MSHVKIAMGELSKLDRGDEPETVKLSELFYGRHFRGRFSPPCYLLWHLLRYIFANISFCLLGFTFV